MGNVILISRMERSANLNSDEWDKLQRYFNRSKSDVRDLLKRLRKYNGGPVCVDWHRGGEFVLRRINTNFKRNNLPYILINTLYFNKYLG